MHSDSGSSRRSSAEKKEEKAASVVDNTSPDRKRAHKELKMIADYAKPRSEDQQELVDLLSVLSDQVSFVSAQVSLVVGILKKNMPLKKEKPNGGMCV